MSAVDNPDFLIRNNQPYPINQKVQLKKSDQATQTALKIRSEKYHPVNWKTVYFTWEKYYIVIIYIALFRNLYIIEM